jgi:hypothetical protein
MRFGKYSPLVTPGFLTIALSLCVCHYQKPGAGSSGPPLREMVGAIPGEWLDEPVITLSDTVEIRFRHDQTGTIVERRERVWYYINKVHPEILKNMVVNDFETMELRPRIAITLFYPDGKKTTAASSDIKRFKGTDEENFSTNRMVNVFPVPRYQQGLIIRLEVAKTITRPSYIRAEILRDEYPCLEKQITLTWPSECSITYSILNNEALAITNSSSSSGPWRSVTVHGSRLKKMQTEYPLRYPERWYAGLHFSLPPEGIRSLSWPEIGDYYLGLINGSLVSSPEIKQLALSITATEKTAIVAEAFRLLQRHVRYIAMEQEIYAIVPRPAPEVLAKGYGDCKEMSALLKMILAEKGITAHLALVSMTDRFQAIDSIPTLGAFNHMIVYLPSFDGRPMFIDPTVRYGHSTNAYYHLLYQKAMVLEPGHSCLKTIDPRPNEGVARVFTSSRIQRSKNDQFWEMQGTITMYDRAAYVFYPYLKELKGEENNPGLVAVLKNIFNVEPSTVSLENYSSDSIRVRYTAAINKQFVNIDKGGFILSSPSLFGGPGTFTTIKREGPRVFETTEQKDEWIVPDGFTDLESTAFDHAFGRGEWSRKAARISRTFFLKRTVAEPSVEFDTSEFLRLQDKFFKATVWHK